MPTLALKLRTLPLNRGKQGRLRDAATSFRAVAQFWLEEALRLDSTSRNTLHHASYQQACRLTRLPPAVVQLALAMAAAAVRSWQGQRQPGSTPSFTRPLPLQIRRDGWSLQRTGSGGLVVRFRVAAGEPPVVLPLACGDYHEAHLRALAAGRCTRGPLLTWEGAGGCWEIRILVVYPPGGLPPAAQVSAGLPYAGLPSAGLPSPELPSPRPASPDPPFGLSQPPGAGEAPPPGTGGTFPASQRVAVLGVDLGLRQLAVVADPDGVINRFISGRSAQRRRQRWIERRARLQVCGRRARARRESGRERRWATGLDHQVARQVVDLACRYGSGLVLEQLRHLRERVRREQPGPPVQLRQALHSGWSFERLRRLLRHKADLAGVRVIEVPAAYSSQDCSRCGHRSASNRRGRRFRCRHCGLELHADLNAGRVLAGRAREEIDLGL